MADKATFIETLSEILVSHRVMSREKANELKRTFGDSAIGEYDDFLLEEGLVEPDDLLKALSVYYKVPSFDVTDYFFRTLLVRQFPKDFLLRNAIIPVEVENQTQLIVVAADPGRSGLESAIRGFVSYDVVFLAGIRRDICDAVKEYYDTAVTQVPDDIDRHDEEREGKDVYRSLMTEEEEEEED